MLPAEEAEAAPPPAARGPAAAAAAAVADLSSDDEALSAQAAIAVCLFCSREDPPPGLLPAVRARVRVAGACSWQRETRTEAIRTFGG
jgi:hypothetical protein